MYQGVEAYPRWDPASVLIYSLTNNPRSRPWPDGYDEVEFAPNRARERDESPRLADKTTLDVGYPVKRGRRERPLFDRTRRVFELLQRRVADQHSRDCALHDDVAQRGLDQAVGMTLADQRFEALSGAGGAGQSRHGRDGQPER